GEAVDALLVHVEPTALARKPPPSERDALVESLATTYGDRLAVQVLPDDVASLVIAAEKRLVDLEVLRDRPDLPTPAPHPLEQAEEAARDALGLARPTRFSRIAQQLAVGHEHRLKERMKSLNWELFDRAVGSTNWAALEELTKLARNGKLTSREATPDELRVIRAALDKPFADRLLLW